LRTDFRRPDEDWVRAVDFEIQVPRVIRLLSYDRLPKRSLRLNRQTVLARDGHRCQYCGQRMPGTELSLDHVIPRSRGGRTCWENVVCACLACNVEKGGRTPKEARMRLARRPSRPKRSPLLAVKLGNPKYESWRTWLEGAFWEVGI
jgi:5-methylcytosine-specific restriction endonuclease McrA